jgi:hypothetical protein
MDVVVIDVLDAWGMLLSRKWVATLGGSLQMDLSYATIPTLDGDFVTLYREPIVRYQVEDPQDPMNELMCMDEGIGNLCVLANFIAQEEEYKGNNDVWTLEFDGAHSSSRSGARIVLISPMHLLHSFLICLSLVVRITSLNTKLDYRIGFALDRKIKCLKVVGDSDLIVSQIKKSLLLRMKD